jgi:hypothetical protein
MSKMFSLIEEAGLIQREIDPPHHRWCSSGHKAPDLFRRTGPESPQEPMRFFEVTSNEIHGIYCEACLIIAHHIAKCKKEGKL